MTVACPKCRAPLADGDAFCMKCGAARIQPPAGQRVPHFCSHFGSPLEEHTKFCAKCGAAVEEAGGSAAGRTPVQPPPPAPQAVPPPPAPPAPTPMATPPAASVASPRQAAPAPATAQAAGPNRVAARQGSPLLKIVAVILGIIAFIVVIGIGSCVYIGYRVEHKVKQFAEEVKKGGLVQNTNNTHYESRALAPCEYKDRAGFDEWTSAAASASIPLKAGLTLTDIWPDPKKQQQDIEILHTVQGVHSSAIEISSMRLDGKSPSYSRNLCIADMMKAREMETQFGPRVPQEMPGTTMFSLSRTEFDDLKAGRPSAVMYYDAYLGEGNTYRFSSEAKGTFSRIEPDDVPYAVIVNGERKDLPTLHIKGDLGKYSYEAWVLDDAHNPLILNMTRPKDKWHITYVKITFPVEKKIEQELAQNGRAEIYGIYFDFNSATLRPESNPVLKEISDALSHHPTWKIKIDGHTDNVGGDAYNQRLSERRAQSVVEALTQRYGIASDRMKPEGFGASRPKATNDTVEGRALNRRVELVRE